MIPLITLTAMILFVCLFVIFWPLIEYKPVAQAPRTTLREFERLLFEKERYLLNLKDLEMDRNMGKMSEDDYQNLRTQLLSEAAAIYSALEKLEKKPLFHKIEEDLKSLERAIL
jgi:hypothetical protein